MNNEQLALQRDIWERTFTLKQTIFQEHMKNIRSQQRYERFMDALGSFSQFIILYVLPALLSGSIGYQMYRLGKSAKIIILKGILTIPFIVLQTCVTIYESLMKTISWSFISIFSKKAYNETYVSLSLNNTKEQASLLFEQTSGNIEEMSQHTLDLTVTILIVFLYVSFLTLTQFLVKWEQIRKFQLGWTSIIIETKERNQTTKYEIEQLVELFHLNQRKNYTETNIDRRTNLELEETQTEEET